MLNKTSQSQKNTYSRRSFIWYAGVDKSIETESRLPGAKEGEGEERLRTCTEFLPGMMKRF